MAAVGALQPGEEKLFEGQPRGFPFEGFQLEDVMLPEDDNMGIPSEDEVDDEEELESETGFGSVIGAHGCRGLLRLVGVCTDKEQSGGRCQLSYKLKLGRGFWALLGLLCTYAHTHTCRLLGVAVFANREVFCQGANNTVVYEFNACTCLRLGVLAW